MYVCIIFYRQNISHSTMTSSCQHFAWFSINQLFLPIAVKLLAETDVDDESLLLNLPIQGSPQGMSQESI